MLKYDYILFDLDDTLFDYDKSDEYALKMVLAELGIPFKTDYFEVFRNIDRYLWTKINTFSGDEFYYARATEFFKAISFEVDIDSFVNQFGKYSSEPFLLTGTEQVCRTLSESSKLFVITNGSIEVRKEKVSKSKIKEYIKKIYSPEEVGFYKPQKEYFDFVLNDIGCINRERVLIVGDTMETDVLGGRNSGIDTCLLKNEKTTIDKSDFQPSFIIQNITELPCLITGCTDK